MTVTSTFSLPRLQRLSWGLTACVLAAAALAGCKSTPKAAQAAPLPANPGQAQVQVSWRQMVGAQGPSTNASLQAGLLVASSASGQLSAVDAQGQARLAAQLRGGALSPAGSDGKHLAAVSQNNHLQVFAEGKLLWQERLSAQSYTAPVVAGERVFVLLADRTVVAFDAATGHKLWQQQRSAHVMEALVLREAGVLMPFGRILLAGIGSHLQGINPDTGRVLWDKTVATTRSTNDVERLADVLAPAWRDGSTVCVRAYQAGLACLDAGLEQLQWTKKSAGQVGLGGDAKAVYGAESDGRIRAYAREDGKNLWVNEQFLLHKLTAPVAWNNWVAVGDQSSGHVYFLQASDGKLLGYQNFGGSGIKTLLVLEGQLLALTQAGQLLALRAPQS